MTVNELYDLVKDFYGYKIHMKSVNSKTKEVMGILYDSFVIRCFINDIDDKFEAKIAVENEEYISVFLNQDCSQKNEEKSIKQKLEIIDNYCQLRLPDKFLDAYYQAYVLDCYKE